MKFKILFLAIATITTNSFSLILSKDTIFTQNRTSDTLTIFNNSPAPITIDTIYEQFKRGGLNVKTFAEISFELKNSPFFYYYNFKPINDTVYETKNESNSKKLIINPNDSIKLFNFIFGRCIWCTETNPPDTINLSIYDFILRFKYNDNLSKPVVCHGTNIYWDDATITEKKTSTRKPKQDSYFDLQGRIYKQTALKKRMGLVLHQFHKN